MKVGVHYLMSCADGQSPVQRYRDTVEQAVHADALGFESVWPVEQHFDRKVSISPCPALLLAAIAERTRSLRLGTAIVQVPLHHPLRVAEEVATLDVLSGGRVELGVGRGSNPGHFAGFGVDIADSRDRFVEGLELMRRALSQETVSFTGRYYQAAGVSLAPRPVQNPHPVMRVAANSPETAALAGRLGLPVIFATHINPLPRVRQFCSIYRQAREQSGHEAPGADAITVLTPLYVALTAEQVRADTEPTLKSFAHLAASALATATAKLPEAERAKVQPVVDRLARLQYEEMNDGLGILDTPDGCAERLAHLQRELGAGRVIAWFNFGGLIPHEVVMRSMELFATRVMPRL
jgi:natural product biosynthesis luciferase-like monooxygenase protein